MVTVIEPTDEMKRVAYGLLPTTARGHIDLALTAVLTIVERDYHVRFRRAGDRQLGNNKVNDAFLRQVAETYRSVEYAPTIAVANRFKVSHSTAVGYVQRSREAGHLEPYRRRSR